MNPPFYFVTEGVIGNNGPFPLIVAESPVGLTVPLGENGAVWPLYIFGNSIDSNVPPTATGDIAIDLDNSVIIITGDGTITAAGSVGAN